LIGSEQPHQFGAIRQVESIVESAPDTHVEGVTGQLNSLNLSEAVEEMVVGAGTPVIRDEYRCHAREILSEQSGRGIGTESRDHTDHVVSHTATIAREGLVLRGSGHCQATEDGMAEVRRALITGVTGQDGSYMAQQLLDMGYEVHGLVRRASSFNRSRIDHLHHDEHIPGKNLHHHYGDVTDAARMHQLVSELRPHEIYNLAAQSHVRVSFDEPLYTANATGLSTLNILEAIRSVDAGIRFYQASTSEMFGASPPPQNEETPLYPRSPYGAAKVYSYWITRNYREAYGLFAVNGQLFNHESPRRGETFVTRKITIGVANIVKGNQKELWMGNLDAIRDWGYAPEYTDGMWRMLQADQPDDYVLATGTAYTIRDFLGFAFGHVGLNWEDHVRFDPKFLRPTEVDELIGDASKAKRKLGWEAKVLTPELATIMVDADIARLKSAPEGRF
jgi:GDPmannose 4,6-dehydratase